MNTDMPQELCPECGAPLTPGAAQGLCAHCLLAGAAAPSEHSAPRSTAPTLAQVAAAFPQLEVLALIGHGGMGAVFKVRQPKLDRFAALKLLPSSLAADPAFASRFEREARLLARLNHPNIVSVYDHGQAGEFFYLLMEFVDGVNLRQAMRASRFTPAQALGIVPKICDALQFAHDEGVLHRDVKPENILLDAKGRVKLADFGIAKLIGESGTGILPVIDASTGRMPVPPSSLTQSGSTLGTPSYMAPEQRDTPADVDHRADIYSLGVVFYELLTGELPRGSFVQPSAKSDADPRVDAIVRQAMEKERERRQGSAGEMRTQVETVTRTGARPPMTSSAPRKTFGARIRRAMLLGAGVLLLVGVVLFGLDRVLPPVYSSHVTMEVKPDNAGFINDLFKGRVSSSMDPIFVSTQFSILQKTEILYQVIDNLKLSESWSAKDQPMSLQGAYKKLLGMMELREVRNTDLVEIGVCSTDAVEAANIANTIAVVYQQKRLTDLQRNIDKGLEQLKDEVEKQRKRADTAAVDMAKIRERVGIIDSNPASADASLSVEKSKDSGVPSFEDKDRFGAYVEAKTIFLQAKRIYEAAQTKFSTELLERGIDFDPAKIWEKAEPALHPTRWSFRRLRYAFS